MVVLLREEGNNYRGEEPESGSTECEDTVQFRWCTPASGVAECRHGSKQHRSELDVAPRAVYRLGVA